jgi:hypothetical protein
MTTLQDVLNTFADGFTQGKADPTYWTAQLFVDTQEPVCA